MREDWKVVKLGEFAAHEKGKKPKNQKTEKDDVFEYPYVNIEAFEKGIIEHYTDGEKCNFCYENDFLMVWDGSRSGLVGKGMDGALGSTLVRINFPGIENNYAFHYLSSKYQEINTRAKGTGTPHVDPYLLWNYDFPISPLPEQRAIVAKIEELFSDLDKGIADLNLAKDQLVVFRQAVLKKAFEGGLTKEWREKQINLPSADELIEQIKEEREKFYNQQLEDWKKAVIEWEKNGKKESKPNKPQKHKEVALLSKSQLEELALLPNKWKWIKNNELMYYVTSGSRDWKKYYSDTKGTFFVRTGDIKTNKLDLSCAAFVDLPSKVEGKRSLIDTGDLLMTITGANVGKIAHIDFNIPEAYVSQSVALMKYVLKSFSPYLHYYFQSSATGAKYIGAMVYGVGRPVLSLDNMRDAPVSVCSFEEQHQIVKEIESRLSVCDKVEQSIEESLEKAKTLRQSILKKAFEGKLLSAAEIERCKQEEDYEPASVLLEKIKKEKKK